MISLFEPLGGSKNETGWVSKNNNDECSPNPCQNGGTCTDGVNAFTCACAPGFTGVTCATNIDDCASAPCENGGTCVDGANRYTCMCPAGFSGTNCETNIDECAPAPCRNGGTCVDQVNGFQCVCAPGYSGPRCATNIDDCSPNPCMAGACVDGVNTYNCVCPPCVSQGVCRAVGTCNTRTGLCTNPAQPDSTPCDDGNACTRTDTCQGGACTGQNPVTCTALGQCYSVGTCDPSTGTCSNPQRTGSCDDGNACTRTDTCQSGTCVGANPVVCTSLGQCYSVGTCNPSTGVCSNPPRTGACDDNNRCTLTDTCQAGTCTGTNPVVCMPMGVCRAAGMCDPGTGTCSNPPALNGTMCDDGMACTMPDTCQNGMCMGTMQTERQDQTQTTFNLGWGSGNSPFWQEFRAGITGRLTRLSVHKNGLSGVQNVTLNVYQGSGVGGTRIYTGPATLPDVSAPVDIVIGPGGPLLMAGQQYTFEIPNPGGFSSLGQTGNAYPNGASGFNYMGFDFWFRTYITPTCP